MIGKTISHYKILEKLGEGGMGIVYKAQDTKLRRTVALKFLASEFTRDQQAKSRFIQEAQAASALDHPNICTIYEIGETADGQLYIAMAHYEGETLQGKIADRQLSIDDCVNYAIQIAEGLQAAHKKGIVHRDVKSSNLMVTQDGQVKIMDFGLAKSVAATMMTKTGTTVGTVPYMSPEQARGDKVDHRTDIWSLGVVLYEMITGKLPFHGEYSEALVYLILNEEPKPLTSLRTDSPVELEGIIKKCLEKDRGIRYRDLNELLADLYRLKGAPISIGLTWRLTKTKFRSPKVIGIVAFAVLLMLAVVVGPHLFQNERNLVDSIAVLPLENLSGNPEQEYLAAGIHEALITDLAKLGGFKKVIARSSVMRYQNSDKPLPQIARELNVDAVVTGSVLRSGNQVRVTAQLVDAATEENLWADRYERELRDVFSLQNEIVGSITEEIKLQLTPVEQTRLATARTINPETYEAYLRGKFYLNQLTPGGLEKGLAYLHQAVEKDSTNALGWAGLALGYSLIGSHSPSPPPDAIPRAKAAALKALELDDTRAESYVTLAQIKLYNEWDWAGAEHAFQRALEINPHLAEAHAHYAWYLNLFDRQEEALAEMRRAQEVDPLEPLWATWIGDLYSSVGESDKAIRAYQKALKQFPDFPWAHFMLGLDLARTGMYDEAIAVEEKAVAANPQWEPALGAVYAFAGQRKRAREIAAELERKSRTTVVNAFGLVVLYVALEEKDAAFRWAEVAYESRHPFTPWLRGAIFGVLHDDPRFQNLMRRMNLPERSL